MLTLSEVMTAGAALAALVLVGGVVGLSLWVMLDKRIRPGSDPRPPWYWDRHGWDE